VNLAISSPLPVLLPLEKGLRALAFAPDHSSKRPGQRRFRASRGAAFSVPFWAGQKGASRRGIPAGWLQEGKSSCMFFTEPFGKEPSGGEKGWWPMRLATASTGRMVSSVLDGGQVRSYGRPMPRRPSTDGGGNPQARSVPSE
jgi:hypothetical protein